MFFTYFYQNHVPIDLTYCLWKIIILKLMAK